MSIIIRILVTAFSAYIVQMILSGVHFDNFLNAIIFAIVFGLLNIFISPVLKLFGLPITIFTLGLFSLVINALIVLLADYFVQGMNIDGFWWALLFSILLSIVSSALNSILGND